MFRREVLADDSRMDRTLGTITAPLLARLRRHPRLRDEQVAMTVRLYMRDAPSAFRISPTVEACGDRARFSISEVRLTASLMNDTAWGDASAQEPGIAVVRHVLALDRGRLKGTWIPHALVSAHALGRWFERTGIRDHAALVRDLAVLALAPDDDEERVATPNGGFWICSMLTVGGVDKVPRRARNVRTWIE